MESLVFLIIVGTSLWVAYDAEKKGAKSGRLGGGFFDMGPIGWLFACLLLWIVAFPAYLVKREEIEKSSSKICPFCAERIKLQAKVCRYCGRDLLDKELNNE